MSNASLGAAGMLLLAAFASNASASDDWFKVYSVAPGVFAITEPRQLESVNSFLIVGSTRAILFDSGLGVARISDVVTKLTALPVADPTQLLELQKALQDIEVGTARSETTASKRRLFKFEHFSILMNGAG